ncbi:MAG: hypothetical protein N3G74_01650 [Candidatus Micrarchaeota archaeon]|nr:hypothetical protein [Candidatus Micrarchaeota archaeon]
MDEKELRLENLRALFGENFSLISKQDLKALESTRIRTINSSYSLLSGIGLDDKRIIKNARLLCLNPIRILRNYMFLTCELKIKKEEICAQPSLLGRDLNTLKNNYILIQRFLKPDSGKKISSLLSMNPNTIMKNFNFLSSKLGISLESTNSHLELLTLSSQTVKYRWQKLRRLFSQNKIRSQPVILTYSSKNIDGNREFMALYGIRPDIVCLYGTSPALKRKKILWISKNIFNSDILKGYEKQEAIRKAKEFVSKYPSLTLYPSISQLEKRIKKLKLMALKVS